MCGKEPDLGVLKELPFRSVDRILTYKSRMDNGEEETRELLLQLEIEEAQARWERIGGKARVASSSTDEQLAIKEYLEELIQSLQTLHDSRLAHSIDNAMDSDADLLALYQDMDQMEISDRALAMRLSRPGSVNIRTRRPQAVPAPIMTPTVERPKPIR